MFFLIIFLMTCHVPLNILFLKTRKTENTTLYFVFIYVRVQLSHDSENTWVKGIARWFTVKWVPEL